MRPTRTPRRRTATVAALAALAMLATTTAAAQPTDDPTTGPVASDGPALLIDPFLQLPTDDSVTVAWVTEWEGAAHVVLVGPWVKTLTVEGVQPFVERLAASSDPASLLREDLRVVDAETLTFSHTREDDRSNVPGRTFDEVTDRDLWRHEATVDGLTAGERTPYRVLSVTEDVEVVMSEVFSLAPAPPPGEPQQILLTSDHQLREMTPANLQLVTETVGQVDAVLFAGDLVNIPDRASEWFDDERGFAFFPSLQGNTDLEITRGETTTRWQGGEILQHAPVFPATGNHEVMGRRGLEGLNDEYNSPLPPEVAERLYAEVADEINPTGDPEVKAAWLDANTWNTTTYEELFTLPGEEVYYATTFDDVRIVSLFATRIWRTPNADADRTGAFREATEDLDTEIDQGWGRFIFEPIAPGSEQYEWLVDELDSPEFAAAEHQVVIMHHPIHTLGDNVSPPFTDPERYVETGPDGETSFIRYEYPADEDVLLHEIAPLFDQAGVDLVLNGHSHVWNRFETAAGVDYLESSNVGNTFGAYHPLSGRERTVPPGAPWDLSNYTIQGDPGGLEPIVPTVAPYIDEATGTPLPFLSSNDVTAFSILDTGTGVVTTYAADLSDPDGGVFVFDEFSITED